MRLHPIISALGRHKASVALVACQIALTLAVVANALHLVVDRVQRFERPTGLAEEGLYLITQSWVSAPHGVTPAEIAKLDAMQLEDVSALRNVPGIEDVTSINSLPLLNATRIGSLQTVPRSGKVTTTALYYADDQATKTLGLKLLDGRAFTSMDIEPRASNAATPIVSVMLTRDLAVSLFGDEHAVGKVIYIDGQTAPTTIVGIVEKLQMPGTGSWASGISYNSVLVPARLDLGFTRYALRLKPGAGKDTIDRARESLFATNSMRIINPEDVRSFDSIRSDAYRSDVAIVALLLIISAVLLGVTAAGIFGIGSFWVVQRRRQIGMRRALGATRMDIIKHFLLENLVISLLGGVVGICLGLYGGMTLMLHFELKTIPPSYLLLGLVAVVVIGQMATLLPAMRAAAVEPMEATRG